MHYNEFVLKRHPGNPIISPSDIPGSYAVFNPGQTLFDGKTLLLLPVAHNAMESGKYGQDITAHVALSDDGVNFDINPEPLFMRTLEGHIGKVREQSIDFRIARIEGTYYIIHPGCGPWGTMGILAKTEDFQSFENIDIVSLPDNRVPCLFPEKINGQYYRLDRPYRVAPNDMHDFGHIWLSSSPDLIHWGRFRPMLRPGFSHWNTTKVGPTTPIKTPEGWLVIIHGVTISSAGHRYSIGAMLLDLENPVKIIGLTRSAILTPYAPYEFNGGVPNVVFPAGSVGDWDNDDIRVYYGAADTYVGLASGSIKELVALCKSEFTEDML